MITYSPSAVTSYGSVLAFGNIDEQHKKIEKEILMKVKAFAKNLGFDLGMLANAYTESNEIKELFEVYGKDFDVYSDSGGLQALTLGKELTTEKPKIYDTQALASHYAMCFDEMPTKVLGERKEGAHTTLDQSGRYYIKNLVESKGIATGLNIKDQIEAFKERQTKTKIMAILQGYDMEHMIKYAKALYSQLDESDYEYIEGISIANTAGPGPFHLVDRIARYQFELDFIPEAHKKHIHILGAGSVGKLMGCVGFSDEYWKYKPNEFKINADATSHSSAGTFGQLTFFDKLGRRVKERTGKDYNKFAKIYLEHIYDFTYEIFKNNGIELTFDDFRNNYSIFNDKGISTIGDIDKTKESETILHSKITKGNRFLWMIHELKMFFILLKLAKDGQFSKVFSQKQQIRCCKLLRSCKSLDDYENVSKLVKAQIHNTYIPIIESESSLLKKTEILKLF